jgi:hypothetical protein
MPGQQGTSQDQSVDPGIDRKLQTATIGEALANIEECSAFRQLIQDADLDYVLRRSGLRTLLAPRNDALKNFSPRSSGRVPEPALAFGCDGVVRSRALPERKDNRGTGASGRNGGWDYTNRQSRNREIRYPVHEWSNTRG